MRKALAALAVAGLAGSLGGCGIYQDIQAVSRDLAKGSDNQDDIATGAPLALPPGYALRPPAASSSSSDSEGTARRAQIILQGDDAAGRRPGRPGVREPGPTAGEREVLTRAGATSATSDVVRRTTDIEAQRRSSGQRDFTDRVLRYDPNAKPEARDDKDARDATGDKPVIKRPGEL